MARLLNSLPRAPSPVSCRLQSEAELPNWKIKVRKKVLHKKFGGGRRRTKKDPVYVDPEELPSDALIWRGEPWKQYRRELWRLQRSIYLCSVDQSTDPSLIEPLQLRLLTSRAARSLAVRRVAMTHPQRRVPGADGVSTLDGHAQKSLRDSLEIDGTSDAFEFRMLSRAWKDMRKSDEGKETVCICTMRDRAKQVLLSWSVEPQLEALFAGTDLFGHRPGRSVRDLVEWIKSVGRDSRPQCMSAIRLTIESSRLISDVVSEKFKGATKDQIMSWIEAGLYDDDLFGIPIGRLGEEKSCPMLPLVSNLLCHEVMASVSEQARIAAFNGTVLVASPSAEVLTSVIGEIRTSAERIGLSADVAVPVTRLAEKSADIFHFTVSQTELASSGGYDCLIAPREGTTESHLRNLTTAFRLSDIFHEDDTGLINRLNPIIQTFTDVFCATDAAEAFEAADSHLKTQLVMWSLHNHSSVSPDEAVDKIFKGTQSRDLAFEVRTRTVRLLKHGDALRRRQIDQTLNTKSPYDGDMDYWRQRLKHWEYNITPSLHLIRD